MTTELKAKLFRSVEVLPVLPHVVLKVLTLNPSAPTYFDELVKVVETEPNYAVRLVAAANSVVSRGVSPITRIRDAVVRLGAREVAGLVVSMSVVRVFVPVTDWERGLWAHAIEVASVSRALARMAGGGLDPERAYLGGLLHDVGRFILFNVAPEVLRQADEASWNSPEGLEEAERRLCGTDHGALGAEVCARWKLPPHLVDFIREHHAPDVEARLPDLDGKLARLVQVADHAAFSSVSSRNDLTCLRDLSPADANALLDAVLPPWFPRRPSLLDEVLAALKQAQVTLQQLGLTPRAVEPRSALAR